VGAEAVRRNQSSVYPQVRPVITVQRNFPNTVSTTNSNTSGVHSSLCRASIIDGRIDTIQATQCFHLHRIVYVGWFAPMLTTCIQATQCVWRSSLYSVATSFSAQLLTLSQVQDIMFLSVNMFLFRLINMIYLMCL